MTVLLYVIAMTGSVGSVIIVWWTLRADFTAIQEAAGFALACATCIIPYVFARSFQEILRSTHESDLPERIGNEIVKAQKRINKFSGND
jgi:hypothetical protein